MANGNGGDSHPTTGGKVNSDDLTLMVFYGLLSGSTSLIPIPLLDDWIYAIIRRQMFQSILIRRDIRLPWEQIRVLTARPNPLKDMGCLKVGATVFLWWPVRFVLYLIAKLFKKVFFILAIKEATDRASEAFHTGYLVDYGIKQVTITSTPFASWVIPLRSSLWEVEKVYETSPIKNVFRGVLRLNRKLVLEAARRFRSAIRIFIRAGNNPATDEKAHRVIDQQEQVLEDVTEETTRIIHDVDEKYLASLREIFDQSARKHHLF